MELGLGDLRVLVTGASKGLGFATAKTLLEEGCNVVINSRSLENLKIAKNNIDKLNFKGNLFIEAGDVTDKNNNKEIISNAVKKLGGLDILITNSGGPPPGTFANLSQTQWDDAINLSFKSHLMLIHNSLPFLRESKYPSVLAITSFTVKNPLDNLILSNTIRAATVALIKSLSIELGHEGIRFNSILPGWTLTDRVDSLLENRSLNNNTNKKIEETKVSDAIPLRRMANPSEFAKPAAFLVSPAASYITGISLTVDGGITRSLL